MLAPDSSGCRLCCVSRSWRFDTGIASSPGIRGSVANSGTAVAPYTYDSRHRSCTITINLTNALGPQPHALALRVQRTLTLANNIANADTPGFKARDFDFKQTLAAQHSPSDQIYRLKRTHAAHLADANAGSLERALLYRTPSLPSLDENTVDVHAEQARFAENSTQLQASLHFLSSRFRGLISAIKGE